MGKDYGVFVKIEFAFSVEATSKKEAIEIVRDILWQENDILLKDKEITMVELYENN